MKWLIKFILPKQARINNANEKYQVCIDNTYQK